MKPNLFRGFKLMYPVAMPVLLCVALFTLAGQAFASWTVPTTIPPGGNVAAPINTSATPQTKQGDLTVAGNFLKLATGDLYIPGSEKGIFWSDETDLPHLEQPHINFLTNTLYISPGDLINNHIELQGDLTFPNVAGCTGVNTLKTDLAGKLVCTTDEVGVGPGGDDKLVKISNLDTTADYLINKLSAGANVTLTTINPGGNEQIQIAASGGGSSLWEAGASANTINPINETTDKVAIGHNNIGDSTQLSVINNSINSTIYAEQNSQFGYAGYFSGGFRVSENKPWDTNWGTLTFDQNTLMLNEENPTIAENPYIWWLNNGLTAAKLGLGSKNSPRHFDLILSNNYDFSIFGGFVGIGTTDPSYQLDVVGSARIASLAGGACLGANTVKADNNGQLICATDLTGGLGGTDELVKASATDSIASYLQDKLSAGSNITLTKLNAGGNEQIQIASSGGSGLWEVGVTANTINPVNEASDKVAIGHNVIGDSTQLSVKNSSVNSAAYFEQAYASGYAAYFSGKTAMMDGDVGIGTTTLTEKLTIAGNIQFSTVGSLLKLKPSAGFASLYTTGSDLRLANGNGNEDRITILTGGNVGISDTTPASLLTVGSGDLFQVDSNGNPIRIRNVTYSWPVGQGGAGTVLTNNGSGNLTWLPAGGSNLWEVGASANTINPINEATDKVAIGHNNIGDLTQLSVKNNSANSAAYFEQANAAGYAAYLSGKTVVMGGRLGVGTATPNQELGLSGDLAMSGGIYKLDGATKFFADTCSGANLSIKTIAADGTVTCETDDGGAVGDNLGDHIARANLRMSGYWVSNDGGNEGLFVDTSGNVGIGTSTPASRLDLYNPIGGSSVLLVQNATTGNTNGDGLEVSVAALGDAYVGSYENRSLSLGTQGRNDLSITGAGSVGIGMTTPTEKLTIAGNVQLSTAGGQLKLKPTAGFASIYTAGTDLRLANGSGNEDRITILTGGNVGINTITPERTLHVNGTIGQGNGQIMEAKDSAGAWNAWMWPRWTDNVMYTNFGSGGWNIRNNSSTNVMYMLNGGQVGIGNTSPASLLTVSATGASGYTVNNTVSAYNNSSSNYNAVSGYKGNSGSGVNGSGVYGELVAGSNCTGTCAGVYGSVGGNTGAGEWAGYFDGDITINGLRAGRGSGNVDGNTIFGNGAGASITTATQQTAIGYQALSSITNTFENTAVGFQALKSTTSSSNVAVGRSALTALTTAAGNVAIGTRSQLNNVSGGYNVSAGYLALENVTSGNFNVGIGRGSGPTSGALENTINIGYGATTSASNSVRIGNASISSATIQVAFSSPSDVRLKENIKDSSLGLGFINSLRPVQYNMKNGNGKTDFGFIAQDIEKLVSPDEYNMLLIDNDAEKTRNLRYNDLMAPMVKAIQEQSQIIDKQSHTIDELTARLDRLEQKVK
ncbi:MAG: tail fiber domain-containing protein [Patescibacteria group bacterium]|jgi:hypothetical protein